MKDFFVDHIIVVHLQDISACKCNKSIFTPDRKQNMLPGCSLLFLLVICAAILPRGHASVLVLGATGRTGSLLYKELKHRGIDDVRALIRDVDKARDVLQCGSCDESEGIYVGDIRNLTSLLPALRQVDTVAIASGASGTESAEDIKEIEFKGIQNVVRALAQKSNVESFGLKNLKVVLCSSEGTTSIPSNNKFSDILFYKLNAEAFLGSVGLATAIVKPCGLSNGAGGNSTLLALHDDTPTPTGSRIIARADVARVMAELVIRKSHQNLRFDLCSIEGPATTNLDQLLDSAKWEWEQVAAASTPTARKTIDQLAQLFFHHPFGFNK